tara:strand:- start:149046 stop:149735 length:690 start_codon:yes stop_codon:yes gene_type:complete
MQNVDELKSRVEETAEKLRTLQEGRSGQSQSLVEMLGQLQEKYAAQSVELEYCRERIEPLETANLELAALMENLLDTIDAGFSKLESDPLQKAADIAGSMLAAEKTEVPVADEIPETTDQVEEVIEENGPEEAQPEVEIDSDTAKTEIEMVVEELADEMREEVSPAAEDIEPNEVEVVFEDVSAATLELESEEDVVSEDLPDACLPPYHFVKMKSYRLSRQKNRYWQMK